MIMPCSHFGRVHIAAFDHQWHMAQGVTGLSASSLGQLGAASRAAAIETDGAKRGAKIRQGRVGDDAFDRDGSTVAAPGGALLVAHGGQGGQARLNRRAAIEDIDIRIGVEALVEQNRKGNSPSGCNCPMASCADAGSKGNVDRILGHQLGNERAAPAARQTLGLRIAMLKNRRPTASQKRRACGSHTPGFSAASLSANRRRCSAMNNSRARDNNCGKCDSAKAGSIKRREQRVAREVMAQMQRMNLVVTFRSCDAWTMISLR